jgi:2-polyprenyl-3-methyl-5-hydroxy-6-metoxy-1,4-benzoquinol methylase
MSRCILCKVELSTYKKEYHLYLYGKPFNFKYIVKCNNCRLGQVENMPTIEQLNEFYSKQKEMAILETLNEQDIAVHKSPEKFDDILNMCFEVSDLNKNDKKKFLDIGAGNGRLLQHFKKFTNWQTTGIEPNQIKCNTMKELSIDHVNGSFEDYYSNLSENQFDFITLIQVLEHLSTPLNIINKISKILKLGGILYVEVPNCSDNYYLTRVDDHFPHLTFWNNQALEHLFKDSNFKILKIGTFGRIIPENINVYQKIIRIIKYFYSWCVPPFIKDIIRQLLLNNNEEVIVDNKDNKEKNVEIKFDNFDYQNLFIVLKNEK